MQLLFLSAAIILGYQIEYLLGSSTHIGTVQHMLLSAILLGAVLFIFKLQFHTTKCAPFITKHTDGFIRLGIVALLQAAIVLIIFTVRSI